ncbi:hypothetical protein INS49_003300 [Diaporthe citri]|uniref:uncharacterized protein n=1 Tax=Diaporthe citri TaxID=83186 RepID=UPI001C7E7527|nr:uncharacterized protein INS49_003300 [Diaporthe citri]KAG6355339.1 hypothetical protein INS49_003300 [Diaporthe citri]
MFRPTLRQSCRSTLSIDSQPTATERSLAFLADTRGPFKQLLATEQTAQTLQARIQERRHEIRAIKQQAIDEDIFHCVIYGNLKLLEMEIAGFKQLLESNESLRRHWRDFHMAAWRATIRPLKVVDLPNEIISMIFSHFEDVPVPKVQVDHDASDDVTLPSPDVASIKNIRLTCRTFCDVGSRLLLPLVDISFTPSSIHRLEKISNHPTISKGVRIIRIYTGTCNSVLDDRDRFCSRTMFKLRLLRLKFQREASRVEKEVEEAFRMIGIPPKPKYLKINGLEMALAEAQDVTQTLRLQRRQHDSSVVPHNRFETKISKAITQAHEEYQRKYFEQKSLIEDCHVHSNIHAAICKMPSVQRLCLTNSSVRRSDDIIRSGWGQRLDIQKFKAILRSPNPFRKLMVDAGDDRFPKASEARDLDLALWSKLPLIFDIGDGNLTHLDITIIAFDESHIEALSGYLQNVRRSCRQLRRVRIEINQRHRPVQTEGFKPAFVTKTWDLLDAMLSSPRLDTVTLDSNFGVEYQDLHSTSSFGAVLGNLPWHNLQRVCLLHLSIKLGELRHALDKVPGKVHLELSGVNLLEGTWAEALEILRGRADSSSLVCQPQGVEFTNMSEQEEKYLRYEFDSEHRDGWYSAQRCPGPASFYIRGGNIPNPLIWSSD